MKQVIKEIEEYIILYLDTRTGIAFVENGKTGNIHSAHPNIDSSGSIKGMKKLGYWSKNDRCIKCHGTIYNIDKAVVRDNLDRIAQRYCKCGGKH